MKLMTLMTRRTMYCIYQRYKEDRRPIREKARGSEPKINDDGLRVTRWTQNARTISLAEATLDDRSVRLRLAMLAACCTKSSRGYNYTDSPVTHSTKAEKVSNKSSMECSEPFSSCDSKIRRRGRRGSRVWHRLNGVIPKFALFLPRHRLDRSLMRLDARRGRRRRRDPAL